MPDQRQTLLAVFGAGDGVSGDDLSAPLATQLLAVVCRETRLPRLPNVAGELLDHLRTVLTTSIPTILTSAWNKRTEFAKYTDPVQYPPGTVSRVSLLPHKVKWKARPTVNVSVNGGPAKKLVFCFDVILDVQAAELKIQGGRFVGMHLGKSTVEGKLTCGDVELIKRKSREYVLPSELAFGDGIPIRKPPPKPPAEPPAPPNS